MAYLAQYAPVLVQYGPFGPEGAYVPSAGALAVVTDGDGNPVSQGEVFLPAIALLTTDRAFEDYRERLEQALQDLLAAEPHEITGPWEHAWIGLAGSNPALTS
jgi:hypothetical protein